MDIIRVWKRIGETPLDALLRAKQEFNIGGKACYTGRLDPMAQGSMTILFGDQVHNAHEHNRSSKIYRFQAVLGVSTNSYDPLGRITNVRQVTAAEAELFYNQITSINGDIRQEIPPCSAYRYQGKPLWKHEVEGTLPQPLPTKIVKVYSITPLQSHPTTVILDEYRKDVLSDISDIGGSVFDLDRITGDWNDLQSWQISHVYRICLEANVGSGTFVRALVHDTAKNIGIPAHAFRITRVKLIN